MWPYWIFYIVPAFVALVGDDAGQSRGSDPTKSKINPGLWIAGLFLSLLIGFRFEVGGDWGGYLKSFAAFRYMTLTDAIETGDPVFSVMNWLSAQSDLGIAAVNFVCAILFSAGLIIFCADQRRPWLAMTIAVPYLVIVVAMGYTRQGAALGLAMIGFVALKRDGMFRFVLWVTAAATIHKSAVVLIPVCALVRSRNRYLTIVFTALSGVTLYYLLLSRDAEALYTNYVEAEYQSSGAILRVGLNAVPALLLIFWRRRFGFLPEDRRLWLSFAICTLVLLGLLFTTSASTAIDRMALYLLPLQLAVLSRLPDAVAFAQASPGAARAVHGQSRRQTSESIVALVVLFYAVVLFVWLNYAVYAGYWLPYQLGLA
jgi:EpsG-like putative glucosyltransferase